MKSTVKSEASDFTRISPGFQPDFTRISPEKKAMMAMMGWLKHEIWPWICSGFSGTPIHLIHDDQWISMGWLKGH